MAAMDKPPPWELKPPPDLVPLCSLDEDGEIRFPIIRQNGESLQNFHPPPQCRSICKQLFTRDLGVHGVAKNYPLLFNYLMESKGSRSLIDKRAGTSMDIRNELNRVIVPTLIQLPWKGKPNRPNGERRRTEEATSTDWLQIDLGKFGGIEVGFAENLLYSWWENTKEHGEEIKPDEKYLLQFYAYTPNNFELVVVASALIMGNIVKARVLDYTSPLDNKPYKFLILLNDANQIQAFDMLARKTTDLLRLDVGDETNNIEDFEIMEKEEQILVMKENVGGDLLEIIIFPYPPGWELVSIINCQHLEVNIGIEHGICLMFQGIADFTIASWENVFREAIQVPVIANNSPNPLLSVGQQLWIPELPPSDIRVPLRIPSAGILNFESPLIFTKVQNGFDFYSALPSTAAVEPPVYRLRGHAGQLGDEYTRVAKFEDSTPRILITNQKSNIYKVVNFQSSAAAAAGDGSRTVSVTESFPFDDLTHHTLRNRQTGMRITTTRKKSVLGMAVCSKGVKMMAVFCGEGNRFNVNIYDASSSQNRFLKALPIVRRETSHDFKVDSISSVKMTFEPDLLIAALTFDLSRRSKSKFTEVYCCPLLLEIF